jgi:hypothetical protein
MAGLLLTKIKFPKMKTLIFSLMMLAAAFSFAQKVYSTDSRYDADIKVFVVDSKYDADLIVYKCDSRYDATGNKGLWYFADSRYDADKKIFFVDSRYDADLLIYFSDSRYDAEWRTSSKQHLLY